MKFVIGSLFSLVLPFAVAYADRPPPHQPPQAAFDACAQAKAGDACSVTLHDHTITGVCAMAPDAQALACRPDHPPGPPPEAIQACSGRATGDACSMTHGDHALAGTCASGPDGNGPLACRPDGAPPHHGGA
jgi:hypothetical protein